MLSKNRVSQLRKLRQHKFRAESRQFIAEGDKLIRELLQGRFKVIEVFCLQEWADRNSELRTQQTTIVTPRELEMISGLVAPNQVLAVFGIPDPVDISSFRPKGLTLALDGIRDPGNLGTMIRTADWFGINTILASEDTVETWNPKVVQSSMGALDRVRVINLDLQSYLSSVTPGIPLLGTFMEAPSIFESALPQDLMLIIGSESGGISSGISKILSGRIGIPRFGSSDGESLNAAISAAICLSEYRRRFPA